MRAFVPTEARPRAANPASSRKPVATLTRPDKGAFGIRINPARYRVGVHRLTATVQFKPSAHTHSKKLRASFQRCAKKLAAPRFTG